MIHIVLFEPEIPNNFGNIIRTCIGFNCQLHTIRPYGFFLDEKNIKRSSVNYISDINIIEYDSYEEFISKNNIDNLFIVTRHGKKTLSDYNFKNCDVYFLFGKESTGLPDEIMKKNISKSIRIPTTKLRSLNLSNTVAIVCYKYAQDNEFLGLDKEEKIKKIY